MSTVREITHTFAWQLDVGQIRSQNEDSVGAVKLNQSSADNNLSIGIYVVADGVGGSDDGAKASKLAVDTVVKAITSQLSKPLDDEAYRDRLKSATLVAHRYVRLNSEHGRKNLTTLVSALLIDNKVHIASVGDSRAYILRDYSLIQVTHDHTVAQALLDAGVFNEEQAKQPKYRNALSQAVGSDHDIKVDVFTKELKIGDYLLLCSDGLYNAIPDESIVHIITQADDTSTASKQLIKAANDAGGPDNISVVLAQMKARD